MTPAEDVPIRDAATTVLVRYRDAKPHVLMGQRGASAAFMANKFVFPGGAVDPSDATLPGAASLNPGTEDLLNLYCDRPMATALAVAAIRELWEETGLVLGNDRGGDVPDWQDFPKDGPVPDGSSLRFFFRAITPPGRPRRFDARFFLASSDHICGDLDDFSKASDELSHLQWVSLNDARSLELPFVTELVLAEVEDILSRPDEPRGIPFFRHGADGGRFETIRPLSA